MLKKVTVKELGESTEELINGVTLADDFLLVKTRNGNAVVISEEEWNNMCEALRMVIEKAGED